MSCRAVARNMLDQNQMACFAGERDGVEGTSGYRERTGEDSDPETDDRCMPRRQLAAGKGSDDRRASFSSEEKVCADDSH